MGLESVINPQARIAEFQRRHRLGLATLVFTDLVGSTALKQQYPEQEAILLIQEHHRRLRELLSQFEQADEIETAGDSFLLIFARPSDAVKFALIWQAQLRVQTRIKPLLERIGIHVGEVFIQEHEQQAKLFGIQVDSCARVMGLAEGGQILMTRFAFDSARAVLRGAEMPGVGGLRWVNHGPYALKGVEEPIEICEVGEESAPLRPPVNSDKAHRHISAESEPVLGWRPALEQVVPQTQWRLERKLGEGGFGEVWLGRHETLKERRVFKFCFRADRVRSLKREVTLFRLLKERVGRHQNIVGIQEVFFEQPPFYIVMDYAEGQDLRAWCDAQGGVKNVPVETRLEIAAQVADALHVAHEAGVIHRDIKPSNILISNLKSETSEAKPEVKLTDFGIGQVLSQEALAGLTRMGFTQTVLSPGSSSQTGTQLYMAPELFAGRPASNRSDIYSLGLVLYQLVIEDFTQPVTTDWARRIHDPLLREDLERCFAGDPQERFASAAELARQLRSLPERRIVQAARLRAALRRRYAWTSAAAALAIVVLGLSISYWRSHGRTPALTWIYIAPFQNETPGEVGDDLGGALTDEFFKELHRWQGVKANFLPAEMVKGGFDSIRMILAQQSVKAFDTLILDGSVAETNQVVRIRLGLINPVDGQRFWGATLERPAAELLGVPGKLAGEVASALHVSGARRRGVPLTTSNPEAYLAYLGGKARLRAGGTLAVRDERNAAAIQDLERAVRLDTNYAEAYGVLARAYNDRSYFLRPQEREWQRNANDAAARALALAPLSGEAHYIAAYCRWTPANGFPSKEAILELRYALELDPELQLAYSSLGIIYGHNGLLDQAKISADQAQLKDPINPEPRYVKGNALLWEGRFQEAIKQLNTLPDFSMNEIRWSYLVWAHLELGETGKAEQILAEHPEDKGGVISSARAILYAMKGDLPHAREQISATVAQRLGFGHFHHSAYNLASAYAIMGDLTNGVYWFEQAVTDGFNCYPLFTIDKNLKPLHGLPAFQKLLAAEKQKFDQLKADLKAH